METWPTCPEGSDSQKKTDVVLAHFCQKQQPQLKTIQPWTVVKGYNSVCIKIEVLTNDNFMKTNLYRENMILLYHAPAVLKVTDMQ